MSVTAQIDLANFAAGAIEHSAEALEAQLATLDQLADAVGLAAQDDAQFQEWRQQIRHALRALRGLE